jgi:hypothetical protein
LAGKNHDAFYKPTWKTRAEVYLLVLSSTTGISGGLGQSRQKQNGRKTKKTKASFILKDIIKICTLKLMWSWLIYADAITKMNKTILKEIPTKTFTVEATKSF